MLFLKGVSKRVYNTIRLERHASISVDKFVHENKDEDADNSYHASFSLRGKFWQQENLGDRRFHNMKILTWKF